MTLTNDHDFDSLMAVATKKSIDCYNLRTIRHEDSKIPQQSQPRAKRKLRLFPHANKSAAALGSSPSSPAQIISEPPKIMGVAMDTLLIVGLLILLSNEETDYHLTLALLYILLM